MSMEVDAKVEVKRSNPSSLPISVSRVSSSSELSKRKGELVKANGIKEAKDDIIDMFDFDDAQLPSTLSSLVEKTEDRNQTRVHLSEISIDLKIDRLKLVDKMNVELFSLLIDDLFLIPKVLYPHRSKVKINHTNQEISLPSLFFEHSIGFFQKAINEKQINLLRKLLLLAAFYLETSPRVFLNFNSKQQTEFMEILRSLANLDRPPIQYLHANRSWALDLEVDEIKQVANQLSDTIHTMQKRETSQNSSNPSHTSSASSANPNPSSSSSTNSSKSISVDSVSSPSRKRKSMDGDDEKKGKDLPKAAEIHYPENACCVAYLLQSFCAHTDAYDDLKRYIRANPSSLSPLPPQFRTANEGLLNHPPIRKFKKEEQELIHKACRFFTQTKGCKDWKTCKYEHEAIIDDPQHGLRKSPSLTKSLKDRHPNMYH